MNANGAVLSANGVRADAKTAQGGVHEMQREPGSSSLLRQMLLWAPGQGWPHEANAFVGAWPDPACPAL